MASSPKAKSKPQALAGRPVTPAVVITRNERGLLPANPKAPATGRPTSQESNRLTGQGIDPNSAAGKAELVAQRLREASGLTAIPEAFRALGGFPGQVSVVGLNALQAFPNFSKLASELERILSLQRNTKLVQ